MIPALISSSLQRCPPDRRTDKGLGWLASLLPPNILSVLHRAANETPGTGSEHAGFNTSFQRTPGVSSDDEEPTSSVA